MMRQHLAQQDLRNRTVGDILRSFGQSSDLERQDTANEYIRREKEAELNNRQATTEHMQEQTAALRRMGPAEFARVLAGTAHTETQTAQIKQAMEDQKDLGKLPRQMMQARYDEMVRNGESAGEIELPNGRKIKVTRGELVDLISKGMGRSSGDFTAYQIYQKSRNDINDAAKREEETRKRNERANEAERAITALTDAKGNKLNPEDPALSNYADDFNQDSDKPYAWVRRGTPHDKTAHKIYLPKISVSGKEIQLTARMIHEGARANGMSDADYLEHLADKRGLKFPERFPWRTQ